MKRRYIALILTLVLWSAFGYGLTASIGRMSGAGSVSLSETTQNFYFRHFDITDGLTQNTIHSILQDKQGFMWFATKDGLNRFDGHVFRRVDINNEGDGNCSFITTIFLDSKGKIWVGAHSGTCVYDPQTEKLEWLGTPADGPHAIKKPTVGFVEISDNIILIITDNDGLYYYYRDKAALKRVLAPSSSGIPQVNRGLVSPNGRIYLGTFGQGLYYTDDNFSTIHPVTADGKPYFGNSVIYAMCQNGDKLYVGTDFMGVHALDMRTGKITPVFISDENGTVPFIRDVLFMSPSRMILGTESGIYIYDIVKEQIVKHLTHNKFDLFSLSDNAVYKVYEDRSGALWAGTYFGGIDYMSPVQLQFDKYVPTHSAGSLTAERIRELVQDRDGMIYVGSEDNGLSLFDPSTGKFSHVEGIAGTNIHGLCIDGRNLWVGTFADGLCIKNLDTGAVRTLRAGSNGLNSNFIFTILRTVHGDIFLGTLNGLLQYDRATDSFREIPELRGKFVYNLAEDSRGNIWVATYVNGLYGRKAGETRFINYRHQKDKPGSLPDDKVYTVQEDSHGNLWVMTQSGACVLRDGKFDRRFMNIDMLPGVVYRMAEDRSGKYWFTTNHGIYCIDGKTGYLRNYTAAQGLPTNQFNYNSSLVTPQGRVYFGSIKGLVAFDPLLMTAQTMPEYKPVVSEIYLHGELLKPGAKDSPLTCSVSLADCINLKPDQNSLAFRLTTLSFDNLGEQRIKYRLLGLDNDWKYTTPEQNLITYSNLPYGKYRLQAAICSDSGDETGPMLDLSLNIATPFYLTGWAIALYIILIILAVYYLFRYYMRNTRLKNQQYLEGCRREQEREAYDSKIRFFTNVAHEIRTPLTLIKAPLGSVFKSECVRKDPEVKENLDVINLNVDRLLLLANQLLDFRKIESGKYTPVRRECDITALIRKLEPRFRPTIESLGKRIDINLSDTPVMACIDVEAITKIISNLFTNAIKYSDSYIKVELTGDEKGFTLTVSNDGEVVAQDKREEIFSLFGRLESHQPGTGIGLAFARSLATAHGGSLTMGSDTDSNVFVLTVPYGTADETGKDVSSETDLELMTRADGDNVCVMVVEDNPELLSFLEKKLVAANFKVYCASDGVKALELLADNFVDIVVSDVMMPVMDGFELLRHIKSDINYSHIPVVLLTAKTRMEDKLEGLESGADAYIEKPFAIEYLLATVDSIISNRKRMRQSLEQLPLAKPAKGLSKVDEDFLRRINDVIRGNFDNPAFSTDALISALGMSRTTFYRKIKGMLDLNPNDYIRIQRLKRAAELFREGHDSVSEVCYLVGFSSPGYFTKCFQKQFGISPKDYIAGKPKVQS